MQQTYSMLMGHTSASAPGVEALILAAACHTLTQTFEITRCAMGEFASSAQTTALRNLKHDAAYRFYTQFASMGLKTLPRVVLCLLLLALPWPTHAAPTREQLARTLSPAPDLVQSAWQEYYADLARTRVEGRTLLEAVANFMHYGFTLTPHQLRLACVNHARGARLRRMVRRQLLAGSQPLKIGVIGTSVSWGTGPSKRGTTDYVSMLPLALQMAFPQANVTSRNGCSPATGSGFANMCLSHMLDDDVDLVLMEFVTNDFVNDELWGNSHTITYERLIRKTLLMRHNPVVMLVQVPAFGQMFNQSHVSHRLWHESGEVIYGPLAQYYGLPALSFRNAWWQDTESVTELAPAGWGSVAASDLIHPNDMGHRSMLDMIMWTVMQTALDLQVTQMTKREVTGIGNPLPAPMQHGNYEEGTSLCMLEDELKGVVEEERSQGWALVNEGTDVKKKIGYVSTTPGSQLFISLDLSAVLGATTFATREQVGVAMAYLQSYTDMGQAVWSCLNGCECEQRVFDAHHTQRTSTSFMALMATNATEPVCNISLQVSTNTSSGGHKFKVNALMVSRMQGMGFHWPTDKSLEWQIVDMLKAEPGQS